MATNQPELLVPIAGAHHLTSVAGSLAPGSKITRSTALPTLSWTAPETQVFFVHPFGSFLSCDDASTSPSQALQFFLAVAKMAVARDAYAQQTLGVNLLEKLNKVRANTGTTSSLPVYSLPGAYVYRRNEPLRDLVRCPSATVGLGQGTTARTLCLELLD